MPRDLACEASMGNATAVCIYSLLMMMLLDLTACLILSTTHGRCYWGNP